MFPWMKHNRGKIALVVAGLLVLSAAYYYGGNAPGLQGWSASAGASASAAASAPVVASISQADSSAEAAGSEGDSSAAPDQSQSTQSTDAKSANLQPAKKSQTAQAKKPTASATESTMTAAEKEAAAKKLNGGVSVEQGDQKYSQSKGMTIDPSTGKDKYQTEPVPEGKPVPVEPQDAVLTDREFTCTFSISCATINDNLDWLDSEKKELVPSDGWILQPTQVTFYEGESVFNVLLRTCKQQGIQMEYKNTPIYNSAYIEGINNLYEFDCGELSGWMYKVNDWFPNYGCSRYQLHDGDTVNWEYTCNLGVDVGGYYSAGVN